jgi:putative thioredoxin
MIGVGTKPEGAGAAAVIDGSDQSFMADVIEASREAAVIVDFWAPWCGPCKQLGPALEAAVQKTKGRARLVKIDVDKHQMVAGQLRVQSIPAVFAFVDGRPVDGFMGALPASEVQAFVDRVAAMGPGGDPVADALAAAEEMLEQGAAADAAEVFAAVLGEQADNTTAIGGLARAYLALGDVVRAKAALDACPPAKAHEAPIASARAAIELAEAAAEAGETVELRARLAADANDHQARFDLATALLAAKDTAGAIDELLELFRRDREWNEGAAKAQLVKIFDSLNPKDPLVAKGRRRLSSMIFA